MGTGNRERLTTGYVLGHDGKFFKKRAVCHFSQWTEKTARDISDEDLATSGAFAVARKPR